MLALVQQRDMATFIVYVKLRLMNHNISKRSKKRVNRNL